MDEAGCEAGDAALEEAPEEGFDPVRDPGIACIRGREEADEAPEEGAEAGEATAIVGAPGTTTSAHTDAYGEDG